MNAAHAAAHGDRNTDEIHHRVDAVRAHLLERAGELDRAVPLYRRAADRTASQAERDDLLVRAARVAELGRTTSG